MRLSHTLRCATLLLAAGMVFAGVGTALAQSVGDPNTVAMQGNAFNAPELTVTTGATVTWLNLDGEQHDVVSWDVSGPLNSPPVDPGGSFSFTFTAPGRYTYLCDLHANMSGAISVVDG